MYLTERLIGLFIYAVVLGLVCLLIALMKKKYLGVILFLYTIILTIMAYNYLPAPGADLYRLIPLMHHWSSLTFSELVSAMLDTAVPVNILYMNLIGKIGYDGMLPAITAFIFYSNIFYILRKGAMKFKTSSIDNSLVLFFFMSVGVFIEVISGIRTMLGLSIVAVCLYRELVENKSILKHLPFYLIAALIHNAVLVLVLIRLNYLLFEKNKSTSQRLLNFLLFTLLSSAIIILGIRYLSAAYEKGVSYIVSGTHWYLWEYLIGIISFIFIIYLLNLTLKIIKKYNEKLKIEKLLNFCIFFSFLMVLFLVEYNTFHRFIIFLTIMSLPIMQFLLSKKYFRNTMIYNLRTIIFLLSCLLLFIASARGNLTSLKFFIL